MEPSFDIITRAMPSVDKYSSYGEHKRQYGELRVPNSVGPHGVLVGIHGGWWTPPYGTETMSHLCDWFSSNSDLATWNVGYRRLGEGGGWPNSVTDVIAATEHLSLLADEYDLDLDRVSLVGFSAGGYLALISHLLREDLYLIEKKRKIVTSSVISIAGALDLGRCEEMSLGDNAARRFLGALQPRAGLSIRKAEPSAWMERACNVVLIHGSSDSSVPHSVSQEFHQQFPQTSSLYTIQDAEHLELIDPKSKYWSEVSKIIFSQF